MSGKKAFADVFYQPGDTPVFCYRTGFAVYEEALIGGVLVSQGYNAAGYPLNVLTNCPTRLDAPSFSYPFAFELEANGIALMHGLSFVDFTYDNTDGTVHAVLTLDSTLVPLRMRIHTVLDGTPMFVRYLELENTADTPLAISRMSVLSGGLESVEPLVSEEFHTEDMYRIGYFDDADWGREGGFAWHTLHPDTTAIDMRFGRGRYRHPLMVLHNQRTGMLWFSQIAYTGGCRFTVDYDNAVEGTATTALCFKAEITGYAPLIVLRAREVFTTPEVHMGVLHGGLDDAVNAMHTHARTGVLTVPEVPGAALLIGAGMGAEHDMSVQTTKAFIDQFAAMGAEVFIIDAGWQNPPGEEMEWTKYNGINRPDAKRYPNGIAELSSYCREKGMKFAMWVEIERLGSECDVFKTHPEWRLNTIYGVQSKGYLDFTNPEAATWAKEELAKIITDNGMDMLRIDNNHHHREYHTVKTMPDGITEYTALRHFAAVEAMYRELKQRFPHVIFENCAGGGGRTDYSFMKAFHHTWVSDWQKAPRSVYITNGMTMALPPERVDRLFAGMGCHTVGSLAWHMRNTMFGHMSLNVIAPAAATANAEQMAFVQHSIALYKEFIRPMLPTAVVYHPSADTKVAQKEGRMLLELASPDGNRGMLGVFTLPNYTGDAIAVTCSGVDRSKRYRVTLDNERQSFEMDGAVLAMQGIRVSMTASLDSELVLYEAI